MDKRLTPNPSSRSTRRTIPLHDEQTVDQPGQLSACVNRLIPESVDDVLAAFDTVSRRITDLARELNCLGYFDDPNGDLPRAA